MSDSPESLDDVIALERLLQPGVRLRNVDIAWSDEARTSVTIRGEVSRATLEAIRAEIEQRREHAKYKWEATRDDDSEEGAFHEGRGHECDAILAIIDRHMKEKGSG